MSTSPLIKPLLHCLTLLCLLGAWAPAQTPASLDKLSAQATAAREAGHTNDAIRLYSQALELRPTWDEGLWYVGSLNYDADRFADAIPPLQSLTKIHPTFAQAWALLGLSEFETPQYQPASEHLARALELGLGDSPDIEKVVRYHRALLLTAGGEFEKATAMLLTQTGGGALPEPIMIALGLALLRAPILPVQLDPSKDALVRSAGETSALLASTSLDQAASAFQRLLQDYPQTPFVRYAYAVALESAGRTDAALEQYHEEVRVNPKSSLAYERIAALELKLKQVAPALEAATQAVKLAPASTAAHQALADALRASGKPDQAAREDQAAASLAKAPAQPDVTTAAFYARNSAPAAPALASSAPGTADPSQFDQLARDAAAAKQAGNTDAAIRNYEAALKLRPDWEPGWADLGTVFYTAQRFADAIPCFKNSVAQNTRRSEAWALLGLSEFETHDYQNSLVHLQRAQALGIGGSPAAVTFAKLHIAMLLNRKGEFDWATSTLVSEVAPGPFLEQIKFVLGISILRLPELPDDVEPAQVPLVRQAGETAALLSQSRYDEAFTLFDVMLKQYPNTPYLEYAYGDAMASISRFDEAMQHLHAETRITPSSALPYVRMALIDLQLRNPQGALPNAQKGAELAPQSADAHYALGRSLLETGKPAEAARELETAAKLAPNRPEIHFNLAKAYAKSGDAAKAESERAVFAQLNALVEQQKSKRGNQSYGASRDRNSVTTADLPPAQDAKPE
jgi:tetratricopeptide (TPR) repeat protein